MDDFSIFWNLVSHFTELRNTIQRSWWFIGYGSPSTRIWLALTTTQHALLNIHLNSVRNVSVCFFRLLLLWCHVVLTIIYIYRKSTSPSVRPCHPSSWNFPTSLLTTHRFQACRKSGIMALDVDVVECHGSGRFIADAIEANDDSMGYLRVQGNPMPPRGS